MRVYALSVLYAAVAEQFAALGGAQAAAQSYLRCRRIAARFLSYQSARDARALQVYFKADIGNTDSLFHAAAEGAACAEPRCVLRVYRQRSVDRTHVRFAESSPAEHAAERHRLCCVSAA